MNYGYIMEDGKLTHLELLPIELGFDAPRYRTGNPRICTDRGILERYAQMSASYGTKININAEGIGIVELNERYALSTCLPL